MAGLNSLSRREKIKEENKFTDFSTTKIGGENEDHNCYICSIVFDSWSDEAKT